MQLKPVNACSNTSDPLLNKFLKSYIIGLAVLSQRMLCCFCKSDWLTVNLSIRNVFSVDFTHFECVMSIQIFLFPALLVCLSFACLLGVFLLRFVSPWSSLYEDLLTRRMRFKGKCAVKHFWEWTRCCVTAVTVNVPLHCHTQSTTSCSESNFYQQVI